VRAARATRVKAMERRVAGDEEGVVRAARAMATATRWQATKRVIARAARAIAMAMTMGGNKEGNGKVGKDDGKGSDDGERQRGQ
jgi:hypothetical protein